MKPFGLVSAAPVASCLFLQYTSSFPSLDLCHCSSFFSRYHHGLLTLRPLFRSRLLSKACLGWSRLLSDPSTHATLRSPLLFHDPICNKFYFPSSILACGLHKDQDLDSLSLLTVVFLVAKPMPHSYILNKYFKGTNGF